MPQGSWANFLLNDWCHHPEKNQKTLVLVKTRNLEAFVKFLSFKSHLFNDATQINLICGFYPKCEALCLPKSVRIKLLLWNYCNYYTYKNVRAWILVLKQSAGFNWVYNFYFVCFIIIMSVYCVFVLSYYEETLCENCTERLGL